jgi:hypothetical protein
MSLSDQQISSLEKLAALHASGALNDEEFAQSKHRILPGAPLGQSAHAAPPSNSPALKWLAGAGVTAAVFLAVFLTTDIGRSADSADPAEDIPVTPPEQAGIDQEPELAGTEICGSRENYVQIKDMIFEKANELYGGDPVALNSLMRSVSVRMQYPVVKGVNEQLGRTDCAGRLLIDLPPGARDNFDGAKTLETDVEFSVQPAADSAGSVITAEGFGYTVNKLLSAASMLGVSRTASGAGPRTGPTFNPSFDCGKRLSNVESMICQDETLAELDRSLSDRYFQLKRALSPATWGRVRRSQREFLIRRSQCGDVECLGATYSDQAATIEMIADSSATEL